MGCFLRCFGSSNGQKPRRHATNRVSSGSKEQRRGYDSVKQAVYPGESLEKPQQAVLSHVIKPIEQAACLNDGKLESPTGLISSFMNREKGIDAMINEVHEPGNEEAATGKGDLASPSCLDSRSVEKSADKLRSEGMKKVIFDSVVITHEPVESSELLFEEVFGGQGKTESLAKFSKMDSLSEAGSVNSNMVSYPANLRYQYCRESDDEEDMDVADGESDDDEYMDDNELSDSVCSMESKSRISSDEQQTETMAVDASLSNWLPSPETKAFHNVVPPEIKPQCPLSPKNLKDMPILGALTVEELKLMSTTSSPRSPPTKSPDGMAIIASVGSRWSSQETDKDSGSVSSYKGIPNTTSKYREDKRVNWHSTPFETRLEKALSRGSARA